MRIFDLFIKKFLDIPLWVKQVIYLKLMSEMKAISLENYLRDTPDEVFADYVPNITFSGQKELTERKYGFDKNIYEFLENCKNGNSITAITMNSFYSPEETSKYLEFCIEQNLIEKPAPKIEALCGYFAGKYRIGEYLLLCGKISQEQLDKALDDLKNNPEKKLGEILVSTELIKEDELKALFILKDEAKKRFIMDYNKLPEAKTLFSDEKSKYENEIANLKNENLKLQKKLEQLLKMVKNET